MRHATGLTFYRVRQNPDHPKRWVRKTWYGRTWQAEWDGVRWCPRAYTRRGIERKVARWIRNNKPTPGMVRRRRWIRRHITRRGELFS